MIKIDWSQVLTNVMSTFLAVLMISAFAMMWKDVMGIRATIEDSTADTRSTAIYSKEAVTIIEAEIIKLKAKDNELVTAFNSFHLEDEITPTKAQPVSYQKVATPEPYVRRLTSLIDPVALVGEDSEDVWEDDSWGVESWGSETVEVAEESGDSMEAGEAGEAGAINEPAPPGVDEDVGDTFVAESAEVIAEPPVLEVYEEDLMKHEMVPSRHYIQEQLPKMNMRSFKN